MTREEFEQFTRAAFVTIYAELFGAVALAKNGEADPNVAHQHCMDATAKVIGDVVNRAHTIAIFESENTFGPPKN